MFYAVLSGVSSAFSSSRRLFSSSHLASKPGVGIINVVLLKLKAIFVLNYLTLLNSLAQQFYLILWYLINDPNYNKQYRSPDCKVRPFFSWLWLINNLFV